MLKALMVKAAFLSTATAVIALPATSAYVTLHSTPAHAQFIDPTAFHVTSSSASGSDPVLLNEGNTFTVNDNDLPAGDTIVSPLEIFLIEPLTAAAPHVTSALFDGTTSDMFSVGPAMLWNTSTTGQSFYKDFLGCGGGCDGSVNLTNINAAEATIGEPAATQFNVFQVNVSMNSGNGFTAKGQFEQLLGSFALGTVVAPFATNGGNKVYDTSWTNAGFVNHTSVSTPEASTWVMMLVGFGLMGAGAWRASGRRLNLSA